MDEIGKTKLLAKLDEWFETVADYGEVDDIEAYEQIKKLIEDSEPKVVDEVDEKLADAVFDSKFEAFKRGRHEGQREAEQLLSQKRVVTREEVKQMFLSMKGVSFPLDEEGWIHYYQLVEKELGISVVK